MSGRAILPDEIKLMTSEMQRQLSRLEEMIYDLDNYMKEIIQTEKLAGETAKNFINHIENHLKEDTKTVIVDAGTITNIDITA